MTAKAETHIDWLTGYGAFGNKTYYVNTAGTFGWNGKSQYQTDASSGLMLLGNRYYDATTGRFISQDPAQDESTWYSYCGNNPLVAVAPSGLFPQPQMATRSPEEVLRAADEKAQAFMAALLKANIGCVFFPWNCLFPELVPAGTDSSKWASLLGEMTGFEWGGVINREAMVKGGPQYYHREAPFLGTTGGNKINFAGHYGSTTVATYHSHPSWNATDLKVVGVSILNRGRKSVGHAHNWVMFVGSRGKTQVYDPTTRATNITYW